MSYSLRMIADNSTDDLLTPREAASLLRVKISTLAIWRCRGRYPLPYIKVGSRICYRRSEIEKFLQSRTVGK